MEHLNLEMVKYLVNIKNADNSDVFRVLISETIARIPSDVQSKALEIVYIVAEPHVKGFPIYLEYAEEKRLVCILLNFSSMHNMNNTSKMGTIAHEIAHIILEHGEGGSPEAEKEADDLIESWGFKRAYTK